MSSSSGGVIVFNKISLGSLSGSYIFNFNIGFSNDILNISGTGCSFKDSYNSLLINCI